MKNHIYAWLIKRHFSSYSSRMRKLKKSLLTSIELTYTWREGINLLEKLYIWLIPLPRTTPIKQNQENNGQLQNANVSYKCPLQHKSNNLHQICCKLTHSTLRNHSLLNLHLSNRNNNNNKLFSPEKNKKRQKHPQYCKSKGTKGNVHIPYFPTIAAFLVLLVCTREKYQKKKTKMSNTTSLYTEYTHIYKNKIMIEPNLTSFGTPNPENAAAHLQCCYCNLLAAQTWRGGWDLVDYGKLDGIYWTTTSWTRSVGWRLAPAPARGGLTTYVRWTTLGGWWAMCREGGKLGGRGRGKYRREREGEKRGKRKMQMGKGRLMHFLNFWES